MNTNNILYSMVALLLLTACGGGSSNTSSNNITYKNIRIEHDNTNDGIVDINQTFLHNNVCNITQEAFDTDMNSIIDKKIIYLYTNNRLVLQKIDNDNDGATDNSIDYTYNSDGLLVQEHIASLNAITTYTYDTQGNRLSKRFDLNGNGVIVSVDTMTYNAQNLRIETRTDQNNDGIINRIVTHVYDSNNNLIRDEINIINSLNDTVVEQIISRTYDSNNRLLSVSDITPSTNVMNSKVTYIYDNNGNIQTTNYDFNNDATIDKIEYYYWAECP